MKTKANRTKSLHGPLITRHSILLAVLLIAVAGTGCKKWYGVPEDKDFLSEQADYTTKSFTPVIGRSTLIGGAFNADASTLPLRFEIMNVRKTDGTPTNDLSQQVPVLEWTSPYTGLETSIAEIEAKRKLASHPLWEVRNSGEFMLWPSSTNALMPNFQGSATPGYLFDVKVSNTGGSRVIKNLTLLPLRERPYDPYNYDVVTGAQKDSIYPTTLNGMVGAVTRQGLSNKSVYVFFKRTGNGNSLTFKFLDQLKAPIDPAAFNQTKWETLVHGFNLDRTTRQYVRYTVAYPIPLAIRPTKYTNADGSKATTAFSYTRLGFNGVRETGRMTLDFSIFRQGDWEIQFQFITEGPRFQDEF